MTKDKDPLPINRDLIPLNKLLPLLLERLKVKKSKKRMNLLLREETQSWCLLSRMRKIGAKKTLCMTSKSWFRPQRLSELRVIAQLSTATGNDLIQGASIREVVLQIPSLFRKAGPSLRWTQEWIKIRGIRAVQIRSQAQISSSNPKSTQDSKVKLLKLTFFKVSHRGTRPRK